MKVLGNCLSLQRKKMVMEKMSKEKRLSDKIGKLHDTYNDSLYIMFQIYNWPFLLVMGPDIQAALY